MELLDRFPDDRTAEEWFVEIRWKHGVRCSHCNSDYIYIRPEEKRRNQPYRCRSCRSDFSVKTGTLMHKSNIGYQAWAVAIHLMTTNLKGVSSMKLHRALGITQKSAWLMMHKIRETFDDVAHEFSISQVEADEAYIGRKEKNKYKSKELNVGRGAVGKTAAIGIKQRGINKVSTSSIASAGTSSVNRYIWDNVRKDATLYTYSATAYTGVNEKHETGDYFVGEYVKLQAQTNGIESLRALLKRSYYCTYHRISENTWFIWSTSLLDDTFPVPKTASTGCSGLLRKWMGSNCHTRSWLDERH